ncbi:hypothetical protein [Lentilitoribacter sp. EG35]|uniref:hypothetical protein n=1 Tax=Lentilitoribacter sp. EG35 TaxID=3234192 RepID=UPI0034601AB7
MPDVPVKSRLVFNFQGFEASAGEKMLGRVVYCAKKTSEVWGISTEQKKQNQHLDEHFVECDLEIIGEKWQVNTRVIQFSFGDIVAPYLDGFIVGNMLKNVPKYLAFFFDGTVFRYFKQSKLYGGFALFPIIMMILFAGLSYGATSSLVGMLNFDDQIQTVSITILSIILFFVFCKWPGDRLLFPLTIGHWGYARDMAVGANEDIEKRYEIFAQVVSRELTISQHDEVVFAGHSFGAVWVPIVLAKVLDQNPSLLEGRRVTFLSMGGSLLSTALVPKASFFREKISKLLKLEELFWHDYQCKDDPVCFYKSDMFKALGLGAPEGGYQISRVNFKHSMDIKRYRKTKKSIYDIHRQYGLYQDKCISFDYFLRLLGPVYSDDLAKQPSKAKFVNTKKDVIVQDGIIQHH